jgi:superfamily II DNA helicase RecQ
MEKDRWDKFDVIIKSIATIIIPVVIGYYTWSQHSIAEENRRSQDAIAEENRRNQDTIAEENRRSQFATELMTRRESSDTDLRTKMFENLMTNFFRQDSDASSAAENERRLLLLGLVGLNFQEFNFKPLFEHLYAVLKPEQKQKLRAMAREISSRQESLLTRGSEAESNYGIAEKIVLSEGMQKNLERINVSLSNLRKQMSIKLWKIADDHVSITLFAFC